MKCLYCNCTESKVVDSRAAEEDNAIRRRRECTGCGRRFTTYETIEFSPVLVVKNNGTRQSYNAEKVIKLPFALPFGKHGQGHLNISHLP